MKEFIFENRYSILFIISILLFLIFLITKYKRWVITVIARVLIGCALILITNFVLQTLHLSMIAGINPYTIAITGLMGFPGLILIYGAIWFFTTF